MEELKNISARAESTGKARNQSYISWIEASSRKADRIIA